jgi:hypothetical protein
MACLVKVRRVPMLKVFSKVCCVSGESAPARDDSITDKADSDVEVCGRFTEKLPHEGALLASTRSMGGYFRLVLCMDRWRRVRAAGQRGWIVEGRLLVLCLALGLELLLELQMIALLGAV